MHILVEPHGVIDSGWKGYHESRRCSRDTYPESYTTKYPSIRRKISPWLSVACGSTYKVGRWSTDLSPELTLLGLRSRSVNLVRQTSGHMCRH